MGLGLAIVVILFFGVLLGFMVVQAKLAAGKWEQVIAAGDRAALEQLLDMTFEGWRSARAPRGMPPADWRALHTAAVVAADRERCRVSLIAGPDVRVVNGRREEVGSERDVARRAAVRMAERVFYEIPHAHFAQAQVDVFAEYRTPDGRSQSTCLLTTRATRDDAASADWAADAPTILAEWRTQESAGAQGVDPDADAVITEAEVDAVRAAEEALRDSRAREPRP
jgi:hypothetical protein